MRELPGVVDTLHLVLDMRLKTLQFEFAWH